MAETASTPTPSAPEPRSPRDMPRVVIRSYPKVIFFWMTWIAALIFGIIEARGGGGDHLGTIFMGIFALNLLVISFDFTEVVSVMVLALIAALVFAGLFFNFLGPIGTFLAGLRIDMNEAFYFTMFGLLSVIFVVVFIKTRLDYWEFRYNEVIHRRGLFADIKRYSTEDLRWFKEVPDVMERILAGSGRMILTTPREPHPIIIDHVLRIGSIDEKVADILGTKRVTIT